MMHRGPPPAHVEEKDPYYYAVVGLTTLSFTVLIWSFTPWFPWP